MIRIPSRLELELTAEKTGFRIEILEKVILLMKVLEVFSEDIFLKNTLALKGGTALNVFYLPYPRLSVDIDLNYVGSYKKDIMLSDRIKITATLEKIFQRLNFIIQKKATDHAGEKWILRYASQVQGMGNLVIDLNFLLRVPLWPIQHLDSFPLGDYQIHNIPLLNKHEIAGGKLRALFSRHSSRDLFDVYQILGSKKFDTNLTRIAFVVYGAMSRQDWRQVSLHSIQFEWRELKNMLIPLLRKSPKEHPREWAEQLIIECKDALSLLLPFSQPEKDFLNHFFNTGEITPDLFVKDPQLVERITQQPGLHWKSMHIRQQLQQIKSVEAQDE